MATPYVTISLDEVGSTQDRAAAEMESSSLPVLIVAREQTGGRGRSGNEWWQAPRAVAASLGFRNEVMEVASAFTLTVGLAVRGAIASVAGIEVALKWPNDLEFGSGKVGGVLVERDDRTTVVGCGLNLWWPNPPDRVAALFRSDPGGDVGEALSRHWATSLLSGAVGWDRSEYRAACSTIGCEVVWEPSGRGTAVDIDQDGGLIVDAGREKLTLRSGAVTTVRRTD